MQIDYKRIFILFLQECFRREIQQYQMHCILFCECVTYCNLNEEDIKKKKIVKKKSLFVESVLLF